ncbi:MAG: C13 family peptidase [Casimicrobiaceae bacterium]
MVEQQDDPQPTVRADARGFVRGVAQNLRCGARAACFAGWGPRILAVSWSQLAALIGLSLALLLGEQMAQVGLHGRLNASGLPYALFDVPLVLVASWAVTSLGRRASATLALMIVTLGAGLAIGAVTWLAEWGVQFAARNVWTAWAQWGLYYLPPLWLALVTAVAGIRIGCVPWRWRPVAVGIALAVIAYPLSTIWIDRTLWAEAPDETAQAGRSFISIASEDAFYQQSRLLARDLAAVLPRDAGHPNLYFIGVAGYASQDVFMREVNAVDALLAERFGTRGHSIRLINNRRTALESPIASRTALAEVLKHVGALMNPEEDVLLLFLTSHGSRDQKLSLQFHPLQLADLTPADLRRMLDEAGIRNRVVIVSACYSGGYVDALKDDDTLIITASAPDRNSFGCSNEADFTYFGKAYFDEALRTTSSFIEAFGIAVPVVAAREKKEDFEPSNPQISIGANIAPRLEALRRALSPGDPVARSGGDAAPGRGAVKAK